MRNSIVAYGHLKREMRPTFYVALMLLQLLLSVACSADAPSQHTAPDAGETSPEPETSAVGTDNAIGTDDTASPEPAMTNVGGPESDVSMAPEPSEPSPSDDVPDAGSTAHTDSGANLLFDAGMESADATPNEPAPEAGVEPQIVSSQPAHQATGVPTTAPLTLVFNTNVVSGIGTFALFDLASVAILDQVAAGGQWVQFDGNKVTITWKSRLQAGTEYGIIISDDAVYSTDGIPFAGLEDPRDLSFTTAGADALVFDSSSPISGTTDYPVDADLSLTFSVSIAAGASGDIVVVNEDTQQEVLRSPVDNTVISIDGNTLTIDLLDNLEPATNYSISIENGAIVSSSGEVFAGLGGDALLPAIEFSTEPPTPPLLTNTSPSAGATNVDPAANIALVFDQAVQAGSGSVSIYESAGALIESVNVQSGAVTFSGDTMTVDFASTLADATEYYVNVSAGAVVSSSDADFAGITDASFSFTTATQAPQPLTLVSTTPASGATDVAADADIVLTFSEQVTSSAGSIVIARTSDDALVEAISSSDARVQVNGATVTINPTTTLTGNTQYYVTVSAGAFESASGASFPGILNTTGLTFTTGGSLALVSTTPADGAVDVNPSAPLVLVFSENVTAGSGNLSITNADTATQVSVAITDSAVDIVSDTVTVTLATPLDPASNYYVTLDAGAVNAVNGGSTLEIIGSTQWNFSTSNGCDSGETLGPNGNCYFVSTAASTWDSASQACNRGTGWTLASVRDDATQQFLQGLVSVESWIGGNDLNSEGTWVWVRDGVQFWQGDSSGNAIPNVFSNFRSSEPTGSGQHCVRILTSTDSWQWADGYCDDTYGFVCEGPSN